jgi:hypothetical protein
LEIFLLCPEYLWFADILIEQADISVGIVFEVIEGINIMVHLRRLIRSRYLVLYIFLVKG